MAAKQAQVDILILTPIRVEYEAVTTILSAPKVWQNKADQNTYLSGRLPGQGRSPVVAVRETGSGLLATAEAVSQGMSLKPKLLVLFGTAGGIKRVKIGDLIIGTTGYSYESGRVVTEGFYSSPRSLPATRRLIELARAVVQQTDRWHQYLPEGSSPAVRFGPIASGNKVITSRYSSLGRQLQERMDDAIGLEMESFAFLKAAANYPVETLIVRGVSDLLDDKREANKNGSKKRAVSNAAALLLGILLDERLNLSKKRHHFKPFALALLTMLLLVFGVVQWRSYSNSQTSNSYPLLIDSSTQKINEVMGPSLAVAESSELAMDKPPPQQPVKKQYQPQSTLGQTDESPPLQDAGGDPASTAHPETSVSTSDTTTTGQADMNDKIDPPEPEALYPCSFFVFRPDNKLAKSVIIDGQIYSLYQPIIDLLPGKHHLKIYYNGTETSEIEFNVLPQKEEQIFNLDFR